MNDVAVFSNYSCTDLKLWPLVGLILARRQNDLWESIFNYILTYILTYLPCCYLFSVR